MAVVNVILDPPLRHDEVAGGSTGIAPYIYEHPEAIVCTVLASRRPKRCRRMPAPGRLRLDLDSDRSGLPNVAGEYVDLRHVPREGDRVTTATMKFSGDEVLACLPNLTPLQRRHRWSVVADTAAEQRRLADCDRCSRPPLARLNRDGFVLHEHAGEDTAARGHRGESDCRAELNARTQASMSTRAHLPPPTSGQAGRSGRAASITVEREKSARQAPPFSASRGLSSTPDRMSAVPTVPTVAAGRTVDAEVPK